jgi:hypothetical protein
LLRGKDLNKISTNKQKDIQMPLKNLKAGNYIVTFTNAGHETLSAEILVSASGVSCIKVTGGSCGSTTPPGINMVSTWSVFGTLKPIVAPPPPPPPEMGYLSVTSTPTGANVSVDGTPIGTTPITHYELPVGTPVVSLTKSGYTPVSQPTTITAGETTPFDVPFIPIPPENKGALSVTSTPTGAAVTVDGASIGTTPISAYELTVGTKSVSLTLEGYETATQSVTIVAGETNDMGTVTLTEVVVPTDVCGWIDEVGVGSLTADHARYVYLLSTGSTVLAELKYQGLTPKPSPIEQSLATLDNARGIYVYSTGGFVLGNLKTGCNY